MRTLAMILLLHTIDGRDIDVFADEITTMREAHDEDDPDRAFTGKVRCMINTTDGKFVTVIEECETIRRMIDDHQPTRR